MAMTRMSMLSLPLFRIRLYDGHSHMTYLPVPELITSTKLWNIVYSFAKFYHELPAERV